jgi:hypothetical protein
VLELRDESLYFLREIAGVQAFLVNVYFIGDQIAPTPLTREYWNAAIEGVNRERGLVHEAPHSVAIVLRAE